MQFTKRPFFFVLSQAWLTIGGGRSEGAGLGGGWRSGPHRELATEADKIERSGVGGVAFFNHFLIFSPRVDIDIKFVKKTGRHFLLEEKEWRASDTIHNLICLYLVYDFDQFMSLI